MRKLFRTNARKLIFRFCLPSVMFTLLSSPVVSQEVDSTDLYHQGTLFYNGRYIPGPYKISSTDTNVIINDIELSSSVTIPRKERDNSLEEARGRRARFRKEKNPRNSQPESESVRLSRNLKKWLDHSEVIVLFDDEIAYSVNTPSEQYELFTLLLEPSPVVSDLSQIIDADLSSTVRSKWKNWIATYRPPPQLAAMMNDFIQQIDDLEAETSHRVAATSRLEVLAYPMTLAGMILSVIAFGQLLQWIGKGFAENEVRKPESERYLVTALILMLGMSLIDLCWTILAGQAGVMREVNPVAAMCMHSPHQLAIFKVVATLIGLSILYIWRQKPLMQQATWWMCLVCVLVTFRWVVFNSMMS